jgi:hypothetical protein
MQRSTLTLTLATSAAIALGALTACSSSSSTDSSTPVDSGSNPNPKDAAPADLGTGNGPDGGPVHDGGGGGNSDALPGGNDGGGGGMDSGGNPVDGGGASSGSGLVTITQQMVAAAGMTFTTYSLSASFSPPAAAGCTENQVASCNVITCPPGGTASYVSAGNVTISGGQLAAPVVLMPNGSNQYTPVSGQMKIYNAGDMFHVTAAGAANGVPAFDQMVAAPSEMTVTSPTFTTGQPVTVNRSANLSLIWTNPANPVGQVSVLLVGPSGGAMNTVIVECLLNLPDGMNSIPSSTLGMIPAGSGAISIRTDSVMNVTAGGFNVGVSVTEGAKTPSGALAAAQATFQ